MNIEKLTEGYVEKSKVVFEAENDREYYRAHDKAFAYLDAVMSVCDVFQRAQIFEAARQSLPEGLPNCLGIPTMTKKEFENLKNLEHA